VVELTIPPLSERREDIPLLADHFLRQAAEHFKRPVKPLSAAALRACVDGEWKGNVRELRSAVEQALLLSASADIEVEDLFPSAPPRPAMALAAGAGDGAPPSFREAKAAAVESFERAFLVAALRRHDGNISKAAEEIGMYRQNLQQKMRELGISAEEIAGSQS
jgi:DNA-binding NtrC family response regulator